MKHIVEEITLKNGAKGLLIDVKDASVMHTLLNFRAGDYLSPEGKWDTAHLLEHIMVGANEKYPKARDFQAELQKNGAFFNAYTNAYDITYVSECADFEWERVLDMMMLAIEKPLFKDNEVEAERGNVQEELTGDINEHFRQLMIQSRQAHGMVSLPDKDRLKQLPSITREDLERHYKKTHQTKNMHFIIAGNIETRKRAILTKLEALSLSKGQLFDLPDETPLHLKEVQYIEQPGVDNVHFMINFLASESLQLEDADALNLLNTMLTSTIHSGILGEVREKGLAYGMWSTFSRGKDVTDWWFGTQVQKDNAHAVFEIISKHLSDVTAGKISDEEIQAAKSYLLGSTKRKVQTVGSLARGYSGNYFFDETIELFDEIDARVEAIDRQRLAAIAQRMMREEIWGVSIGGTCGYKFASSLQERIAVLWQ